jgi:hypothetical protein
MQPCFPPGEKMAEDLDLWFRLAELFPLRHSPAQLVAYRIGIENSLCASNQGSSFWPAFERLEQRVLQGTIQPALLDSAAAVVAQERVTEARKMLLAGSRYAALRMLLHVRKGFSYRRWWVTLFATLCMSTQQFANFINHNAKKKHS